MPDYRKVVIDHLLPYFTRDKRFYLLAGDMGFGAVDQLQHVYPQRIINCGVMEPGAVGIAAGMSMSGLIPIFYTIVNFLAFRALEQVRNDVILQNLNVKFIGTGANDHFQMLGRSHCCGDDDVKIMRLINMNVYDPYDDAASSASHAANAFEKLVEQWITDVRPGYLRV
jgi:transketolase